MAALPVSFSALTSDIERDPSLLQSMQLEAWSRTVNTLPHGKVLTVIDGPITTVKAVRS